MKWISLFDGISCGMVAALKAGLVVDEYHAYEIDANAITVSTWHFPDIVRHGSVIKADFTKHRGADIVIGGSPCNNLSSAGTGGGTYGER